MSRPYYRRCKECGAKFKSRSNGRVYCYKCSPPQVAGRSRNDGGVSGTGLPPRSKMSEYADVPADHPDHNDKAAEEIAEAKYVREAGLRKGSPKKLRFGDEVKDEGRPREGWGRCKFKDPDNPRAANCARERWSQTTPFCMQHVEWWQERKAEQRSLKMAEEEKAKAKAKPFKLSDFKVRTYQQARDLLGKINFAAFNGDLSIEKSKGLKDLVMAQVKSLDSELTAKKVNAKLGENEADEYVIPEETAETDKELADEFGITEGGKGGDEGKEPAPAPEDDTASAQPQDPQRGGELVDDADGQSCSAQVDEGGGADVAPESLPGEGKEGEGDVGTRCSRGDVPGVQGPPGGGQASRD